VCPLRGQSLEARLAVQASVRHAGSSAVSDYNRLIEKAARARLAPIACIQQGRSRTWLDDHGWWVGVIDFHPSSWSKGTYLNVGACWLWDGDDHFSFDYGYRVQGFQAYEDDDQFTPIANRVATKAEAAVKRLRRKFPTVRAVAWRLRLKLSMGVWDHYHVAIANGLAGKVRVARRHFELLSQPDEDRRDWVCDLKARAEVLSRALSDPSHFESEVRNMVAASRQLVGLPPLDQRFRFDA